LTFRPAKFYRDISALDVTRFTETLAERCDPAGERGRRLGAEIADHRHGGLLRARRQRPRSRRTAEQCDELAPIHLIELHPIPHEPGPRKAAYRIAWDWSGGVSGALLQPVGCWLASARMEGGMLSKPGCASWRAA